MLRFSDRNILSHAPRFHRFRRFFQAHPPKHTSNSPKIPNDTLNPTMTLVFVLSLLFIALPPPVVALESGKVGKFGLVLGGEVGGGVDGTEVYVVPGPL